MELINFDIASEIKTRILLERGLGERTSQRLIDRLETMPDHSVFLVDITGADVIDYNFCSAAVGPLIKSLTENRFKNKYVIIKIDPDLKLNLLEGILVFLSIKTSEKDSEESFIERNLAIKLLNTQTNEIEFIGELSGYKKDILNLINEKLEMSSTDISKEIGKPVEEIIKNLKELEDQFFIYTKRRVNEILYYSFYTCLK